MNELSIKAICRPKENLRTFKKLYMYQEVSQILKGMEGRVLDSVQQFSCRLEVASVRQSLDMLLWIVLATLSTTRGLSIS